jgi:hypothetical protein
MRPARNIKWPNRANRSRVAAAVNPTSAPTTAAPRVPATSPPAAIAAAATTSWISAGSIRDSVAPAGRSW